MKKKRKIKTVLTAGTALAALLATAPASCLAEEITMYTATDFAMDTVLTETIYTTGEDITGEITQILKDMEEQEISWTYEDSEVSKINESAGESVEISQDLADNLQKALTLCADSGGALDVTLGDLIRLWDIDGENPHIPDADELESLLEKTGYQKVALDGTTVTLSDGASLELGAVGKGMGSDAAMQYLEEQSDVTAAVLNLGGSSVLTYGTKPDGSDWKVAITDPRDTEGDYLGAVTLKGGEYLSTSGDYEKYFIEDGVRYHHILDPSTGYPAQSGVCAVTVICSDGLYADGLSTACFVLGKDKALELLEKYNAEALFVDEDKNVYVTDGMAERFELLKDGYTLTEE